MWNMEFNIFFQTYSHTNQMKSKVMMHFSVHWSYHMPGIVAGYLMALWTRDYVNKIKLWGQSQQLVDRNQPERIEGWRNQEYGQREHGKEEGETLGICLNLSGLEEWREVSLAGSLAKRKASWLLLSLSGLGFHPNMWLLSTGKQMIQT